MKRKHRFIEIQTTCRQNIQFYIDETRQQIKELPPGPKRNSFIRLLKELAIRLEKATNDPITVRRIIRKEG